MPSYDILTTESEIEALAGEWKQLYARLGRTPFMDYDLFSIWWNVIGKSDPRRTLHIVVARENAKLTGVLPLTVVRSKGLRIMQAAGYRAYNYCDMLAENAAQALQLWQAARQSPHYDFADIRDVYPESVCYEALATFAHRRDLSDAFAVRVQWKSGKDWLKSLSSHTRGNFKRCTRRLEEKGPVRFEVFSGRTPPAEIIDNMIRQKVAWGSVRKIRGIYEHPDVLAYFRRIIEAAAANGSLFLGWLKCGKQVIAYNQGFIHNGVLHCVVWTYDPDWSRCSPGKVVLTNAIMWAVDNGLQAVDLRQGANQFKKLHANEKRQCAEFTFNGSLRGRLIETVYMTARSLLRTVRGDPDHAATAGED